MAVPVVKEKALDPALLAKARALWWAQNPAPDVVREGDPESWLGGFDARVADAVKAANDESQTVEGDQWRCRRVAGCAAFLDLLPRAVWSYAMGRRVIGCHLHVRHVIKPIKDI